MAVSEEAGKALGLISGIDVCHKVQPDYWRSAVARIVLDLDEAAQHEALRVIGAMLREQWGLLGADRARAKPLAEHGGVETADIPGWQRSTFCKPTRLGDCVVVHRYGDDVIGVQDARVAGDSLAKLFSPESWQAFVAGVKNGEFDFGEVPADEH